MSRIDDKFAALRGQGFTGSLSDMTHQWLQANGATSASLSTAWREMLSALGFEGQHNDSWYAFLGSIGFEGAIADRTAEFWAAGGAPVPPVWGIVPALEFSQAALPDGYDMNLSVVGASLTGWALSGEPPEITIDDSGLVTVANTIPVGPTAPMTCYVENTAGSDISAAFTWTIVV
jgi:hypothetical protein